MWEEIRASLLHEINASQNKYHLIEELVQKRKEALNGNNVKANSPQGNEEINQINKEESEDYALENKDSKLQEKLNKEFKRYRDNNDYQGAKGKFANALKKHSSEKVFVCMNIRSELYAAQYAAFKKLKERSSGYGLAMNAWLVDHNAIESENLFINEILTDPVDKGTAILAYIDMIAVEFGLDDAVKAMLDMQQEIKYCDRKEKVAFYEKKYGLAFASGNYSDALGALGTLKDLYYNKRKLGECWYRTGECYFVQKKWKQAASSYLKSAEKGYKENLCQHRIKYCNAQMAEKAEGQSEETIQKRLESISDITRKLEDFYNQARYIDANIYVRALAKDFPENEELQEIAKRSEDTARRYAEVGPKLPQGKDLQAIALRAWHVEENYQKAKSHFKMEIESGGAKKYSCIMDLSELLLHIEGTESAIDSLISYEYLINERKVSDRTGFYEKLYLLYLKKGDTDGISSTLKKLIDLYTELGKVEKIAFTNYRFAIALYQQRRYQDTIDTMKMALEGGYHHNNCYKCIALSYAYLGDKFRAEEFLMNLTNSKIEAVENLQSFIDELRSQVTEIFSSYKDKGVDDEQILHEIEGEEFYNDFMFGLNTRAESFFIDRYGTNPVGIKSTSLDKYGFREVDVNRLEDEGANHKVRESMGFYGTAAFIENQINGNSTRYYDLLSKCARAWGIELQGNGQFNSAAACFEFSMENENRNGRKGEKNALRYLFCILRKRSYDTLPEKSKLVPIERTADRQIQAPLEGANFIDESEVPT